MHKRYLITIKMEVNLLGNQYKIVKGILKIRHTPSYGNT